MNKHDLIKNRWPILLLIPPIFSFMSDMLNIAEKLPPKIKPFIQLFMNALSLPVPIYSVLLGAAVGAFLFINFGRKDEMSLKELEKRIDIDLRSHAEQVHFYLSEKSEMRIWLRIINFSPDELVIDKVIWVFSMKELTKEDGKIIHHKILPFEKYQNLVIDRKLAAHEADEIREAAMKDVERKGNLSLIVTFTANKRQFEERISIPEAHYTISGFTEAPETKLSDKEKYILKLLAGADSKKIQRADLKRSLEEKFKLDPTEFNVLINELIQRKMICTSFDKRPISSPNAWLGNEYRSIESFVIIGKGLSELKK